MADFIVTEATALHAADLAPRMREADTMEVWATWHATPASALETSLSLSSHAWAGLVNGSVVCMWGVAPTSLMAGEGVAWLLGSDLIDQYRRAFVKAHARSLPAVLECYSHVFNHVDARYTKSVEWLRWLGFEIQPPQPFGFQGLPFHRVDYWRD